LAWLDNVLDIKETANETLNDIYYDFRIFDSPIRLKEAIFKKNKINNKARLVAGYCWNWASKKAENSSLNDIIIEEHDFAMQWNLSTDSSLWIRKPNSVSEVGCIHTCQGLEVDYIGVIIGPDFIVRNGEVIIQPDKRARTDQSLKGYKSAFKENPDSATQKAETIIKNTYRTLMTRGQKGCYIFCTDPETNTYFEKVAKSIVELQEQDVTNKIGQPFPEEIPSEKYSGLNHKILQFSKVEPFVNAVPIYDLKIAAGQFSNEQNIEECDWVELPDSFRPQKGHFVTRVDGESMNKRIPNGAWCLFKANPGGSRNNKVVIVQHIDIQDQDTSASFTIKLYRSEKVLDEDGWHHTKIVLQPDSYSSEYENLVIDNEIEDELRVIGEFVAVISY
jgi:DUF2075 family protein